MPRTAFWKAKTWPEYPLSNWAATERGTRLARIRMATGFGVGAYGRTSLCPAARDNEKNIRTYSTPSTPPWTKVVPSLW